MKHFIHITIIIVYYVCLFGEAKGSTDSMIFTEEPTTQEVNPGANAVFRCWHPTASYIRWRVNGSLLERDPPPDITPGIICDDDGNLVDTLTITARPEFNGTEVVCVAKFNDGTPAINSSMALLIVGKVDFEIVPQSRNVSVSVVPVVFVCAHPTAFSVRIFTDASPTCEILRRSGPKGTVQSLFTNLSMCSETVTIWCRAYFVDGNQNFNSSTAVLGIQGNLQEVTKLHRNFSTVTWTPPFSLDLTGADPDIAYRVEVYNITCGRRDLIISDCNVTEPSYTSGDILDGYIYEYAVTPRSNVEEASNGATQTIKEHFPMFTVLKSQVSKNDTFITAKMWLTPEEADRPLPLFFTVSLESADGNYKVKVSTQLIVDDADRSIIIPGLPPNMLLKCTVFAYGCQDNSKVLDHELSTQNVFFDSPSPGVIRVTGDLIGGNGTRQLLTKHMLGEMVIFTIAVTITVQWLLEY